MEYFITKYDCDCPPASESAVLEDSIMHRGRPVTAGSAILKNFISPLSATVVTRLETAGITILGKTKMDEFGIAGLFIDAPSETSGAVSAVADGAASFALCNDYTGAISRQASARGICHIRPTYGTVSRYGLIPAAPSMDQICILAKTPQEGFRVLSIIAGHDPKDGAMYNVQTAADGGQRTTESGRLRIGLPKNVLAQTSDISAVEELAKSFDTVEFELKYFDIFSQIMQILCCAEISGGISRYDGIKYGYRPDSFANLHELYTKSRTEAFGQYAKLAAIIGAMALSQENYLRFYDKAMRIRRLIRDCLEFDRYDVIAMPASGAEPDRRLALNSLPQLCGLPAVTMPFGNGVTLIADVMREDMLFAMSSAVKTTS